MAADADLDLARSIFFAMGAIVGLGSGVIAQIAAHRFARDRENEKIVLEKAECLVEALYDHRRWLEETQSELLYGGSPAKIKNPIDAVRTIQKLYFPSLNAEADAMSESLLPIVQYMYDQCAARLKNQEEYLKSRDQKIFMELYSHYLDATNSFVTAIIRMIPLELRK